MCTGDNMHTALSVARDCKMISRDKKVILVEETESDDQPTFTYAEIHDRHDPEDHASRTVRKHSFF